MKGVMCGIDAVGNQALNRDDPTKEKHSQVIDDLVRLVNPTGRIGIIGVFLPENPGSQTAASKKGEYVLPLGALWEKAIAVGTGQTPVRRFDQHLRDLIVAGRANPGFIVSHEILLADAADACEKFDRPNADTPKSS